MIRFFDLVFSFIGIVVLTPIGLLLSILIKLESKGDIFYRQSRIGQFGKPFKLYKFRTMHVGADKKGLLTVGSKDNRVTKIGYFLRKYKLDELPQLINVLKGEMCLVGPRPEVEKYVSLYTPKQREVLKIKPGITDTASIYYKDENEVIARASNPEEVYIKEIMPHKIDLNMGFVQRPSVIKYFIIIFKTIIKIGS